MEDIDGAAQAQFRDLIGRLRAKRLCAELPAPPEALPPDVEAAPDDSGDQAALESMLESE